MKTPVLKHFSEGRIISSVLFLTLGALIPLTAFGFIANSNRLVVSFPRHFHYPNPNLDAVRGINRIRPPLHARADRDGEDDEESSEIDLSEQDWRTFRAKLVMSENSSLDVTGSISSSPSADLEDGDLDGIGSLFSSSAEKSTDQQANKLMQGMTPLDPSQWAYDSGKVIEKGAVILGGVEQDYGFGLRQQYFHKAAILVLDHAESLFTKGIILNRPTDLTLDDDINKGVTWRVWFGGDVQGFNSGNPDIICIHSLKNDRAVRLSTTVMKDIQWTSFEDAKKLVQSGDAKPTDFWVFSGYAGWGSGQLMGELERKSWYMVATDSQTLLKELARQSAGADPRDAGLETWTLLMNMIGRSQTVKDHTGKFDDLMLKEWALKNLLSKAGGGGADVVVEQKPSGMFILDESLGLKLKSGALLRGTSLPRSPFLLDDQELHKSIVLIISDDVNICLGVILSRPAAKSLDVQLTETKSKTSTKVQIPLRYGGQYAVKGSDPLLWLHCNPALKLASIGSPIGSSDGIWKCTSDDVVLSVGLGLASPNQFMVVSGVLFLAKKKGMASDTKLSDRFEIVPDDKISNIWSELSKQEILSDKTLDSNLKLAHNAWSQGGQNIKEKNGKDTSVPISGLGEGFDEDDDSLVFKSNVKVSDLCDDALRSWIATFLLGTPSLN